MIINGEDIIWNDSRKELDEFNEGSFVWCIYQEDDQPRTFKIVSLLLQKDYPDEKSIILDSDDE